MTHFTRANFCLVLPVWGVTVQLYRSADFFLLLFRDNQCKLITTESQLMCVCAPISRSDKHSNILTNSVGICVNKTNPWAFSRLSHKRVKGFIKMLVLWALIIVIFKKIYILTLLYFGHPFLWIQRNFRKIQRKICHQILFALISHRMVLSI